MYAEDEIISAVPIPALLKTDEVSISIQTEYPFKNEFVYYIESKKTFKFKVRIPSFAEKVVVNGDEVREIQDLAFDISENDNKEIRICFETKPVLFERPYDLRTLKYGSLVFSLPIQYEKVMYEYERKGVERKYPYCDYEYVGKSDWNYGYCGDEFEVISKKVDEIPFSSKNPPITIKTKVVPIDWGLEDGYETVCAKVPISREALGEEKIMELYPYGCAKLRMTEMPLVRKDTKPTL